MLGQNFRIRSRGMSEQVQTYAKKRPPDLLPYVHTLRHGGCPGCPSSAVKAKKTPPRIDVVGGPTTVQPQTKEGLGSGHRDVPVLASTGTSSFKVGPGMISGPEGERSRCPLRVVPGLNKPPPNNE